MAKIQFKALYREFLFRMVDRELLSAHAQGDASKLLGRFAALLICVSIPFAAMALGIGNGQGPRQAALIAAWGPEHILIATTMLVIGLFAVLSWDSTFPDRRDVLVLAPLPVRASTIFLAKLASLATLERELQFEEEPHPVIVSLGLHRDGFLPIESGPALLSSDADGDRVAWY